MSLIPRLVHGPVERVDYQPTVRVEQGRFSISQLIGWSEALDAADVFGSGATFLDADEMRNRVRVGVVSTAVIPVIEQVASLLGVPREALLFVNSPSRVEIAANLSDQIRPLSGGLQMNRWVTPTEGYTCTTGFNVHNPNTLDRYMLTASHCTGSYAGGTGMQFHQTANNNSGYIGNVTHNPAWGTSSCAFGGYYCRASDAALIGAAITSEARVAETTTIGTGNNAGSTTIGRWREINGYMDGAQGTTAWKTGQFTGTTQGTITATCINPGRSAEGQEVTCSNEVQMRGTKGDSGGPVYGQAYVAPTSSPLRQAMGILWGFKLNQSDNLWYIYYSPWSSIESELGMTLWPWEPW